MSKSFLSIESTEREAGSLEPQRQCNALRGFDLFCIRFGRTARAVRDFVTCSSPQSSGFMEDNTTTASQEYSSPIEDDLDETPTSTTEVQPSVGPQALPKPAIMRDVWSIRNGISPIHEEFVRHQSDSLKVKARHPGHCHQRITFAQVSAGRSPQPKANAEKNAECNRRACGVEVTSTSTCGPKLPINYFELPTKQRLRAVKHFLADFVCKPNSETSLQANKQRPLCRLMAAARMIVYKPEPIKSVEAVFLALYLTAGLLAVERIPLCFKTKFVDEVSQHIVVLVQYNGKFGSFGLSPHPDLMTKDLQFDSMSSIVENYVKAYKAIDHTVLKIRIGLPVEHDIMSTHFICWRHLCLSPDVKPWAECVVEIENHALRMRRLWDLWVLSGKGDDPRKAKMARRASTMESKQAPMIPAAKVESSKAIKRGHDDAAECGAGSDGTECEHCEQLKREAPPVETKRACVTSVKRPRSKKGDSTTQSSSTMDSTRALLASAAHELQHRERKLQGASSRRSLNHVSLASTRQILKNFVHNSVLLSSSTSPKPAARFSRRPHGHAHAQPAAAAAAGPGAKSVRKKMNRAPGPLYNMTLAAAKSKAG